MSDKFFKQTWWRDNLSDEVMYKTYLSWLGGERSSSVQFCVDFVTQHSINSMVDLGCGPCLAFDRMSVKNPLTSYTGLDSCEHLASINRDKGILFVLGIIEQTGFNDREFEFAYSRAVIEHLPRFEDALSEMIRITSRYAMHIFFIPPNETPTQIHFTEHDQLYHNHYSQDDIENFLMTKAYNKDRVKNFQWKQVNDVEKALIIEVK